MSCVRALGLAIFSGVLSANIGCSGGIDQGASYEGSTDFTRREVTAYAAVSPPEYRVTRAPLPGLVGPALPAGRKIAVIRTGTYQTEEARLVVDTESYAVSLVAASALAAGSRVATAVDGIENTPYVRSLADIARRGVALQHLAPAARSVDSVERFALTIDMCQSNRPWEAGLFRWAKVLSDDLGKPVPVGIAMTGVWAKAHPTELDELIAWERAGKLAITWINHSSTHPLHCFDRSCIRGEFLTASSVDFDEEVLGEERTILARGMTPSTLFRFPGLVHDANRLKQLGRLSLMPLDADAWIALGQPIRPWSVVLVHGNGNEPEGIREFLRQVSMPARAAALRSGQAVIESALQAAPFSPLSPL